MRDQLIAACGLTCSECEAYLASQANDAEGIQRLADQWSEEYGGEVLADMVWCDGCMTGDQRHCGHVEECEIRACVVHHELENCAGCADFVCDMLEEFYHRAPESGARETLQSLRG